MRWWNADSASYERWYVNLESDWTRTPIGFDSQDLICDVEVDDECARAWLKDDDELTFARARGLISAQDADRARIEAETVVQLIAERRSLFGADWSRWRPDPGWDRPPLRDGWDRT
jgi:predicted RNA-binding protein associated with RNAse of E/G family